ncbi:MAG: helix-turn-helix domain-containing protein, partial [Thermogladius sp.]|nr:helix-turn-helix domain-containing protein [Thermogladius sp.]
MTIQLVKPWRETLPGEDIDRIFTALSHEIRREIIRVLAEKPPKTFSELMNELHIEDTGTMVFHLRKLSGLIEKNERGEYVLTDLGRRAYQLLRQLESGGGGVAEVASGKRGEGERMGEAGGSEGARAVPGTLVIGDRLRLHLDRDFLESVKSSGKKLVVRDVIDLTISDDVDPALFGETVEEISDVISLKAPKRLRSMVELKSRDVLSISYFEEAPGKPSRLDLSSRIGGVSEMISATVTSVLASVFKSLPKLAGRGVERFAEKKLVYSSEIPENVSRVRIEVERGVVYTVESEKPRVAIYSAGRGCSEGDYSIDYKGDEMTLTVEGCVADITLPRRLFESVSVEVADGVVDVRFNQGFKQAWIEVEGGLVNISSPNTPASSLRGEVNGGLLTLKLGYARYEGESSLDLEVNGG